MKTHFWILVLFFVWLINPAKSQVQTGYDNDAHCAQTIVKGCDRGAECAFKKEPGLGNIKIDPALCSACVPRAWQACEGWKGEYRIFRKDSKTAEEFYALLEEAGEYATKFNAQYTPTNVHLRNQKNIAIPGLKALAEEAYLVGVLRGPYAFQEYLDENAKELGRGSLYEQWKLTDFKVALTYRFGWDMKPPIPKNPFKPSKWFTAWVKKSVKEDLDRSDQVTLIQDRDDVRAEIQKLEQNYRANR